MTGVCVVTLPRIPEAADKSDRNSQREQAGSEASEPDETKRPRCEAAMVTDRWREQMASDMTSGQWKRFVLKVVSMMRTTPLRHRLYTISADM